MYKLSLNVGKSTVGAYVYEVKNTSQIVVASFSVKKMIQGSRPLNKQSILNLVEEGRDYTELNRVLK